MLNSFRWMAVMGTLAALAACSRPTPIASVLPSPLPITLTASGTPAPPPTLRPLPTAAPSLTASASAWPTVQTSTPIVLMSDTPTLAASATETPTPSATPLRPETPAVAVSATRSPESPSATSPSATSTSTVTPSPTPTAWPLPAYLSNIGPRAREIFVAGQQRGQNAHAFALVGDSNTDNPAFFAPFDAGNYALGDYAYLQETIVYFSGSFGRDSISAVGSFNTAKELDPAYNDPARCAATESPLACEYRLHRPSVALILLGTGDQHTWEGFEARYRQIVEYTIGQGIVPVLLTKADDLESRENTAPPGYINGVIARLSAEYEAPLLDVWQAVAPLPNRGLRPDGFHYNSPPDGQAAFLLPGYLNYGFNVRNLTALQALEAVRRAVMFDAP